MTNTHSGRQSFLRATLFLQVVSCLFFTFDVIKDVTEHMRNNIPYAGTEAIHMLFEFVAVVGLLLGSVSMWRALQHNIQLNMQANETIKIQRGHFDEVALTRFKVWAFTNSETDVAKLILRGMSLKEIAEARTVSIGTIKAQTNSILKKSGAENRAAFLGLFIDEFLDDTLNNNQQPL